MSRRSPLVTVTPGKFAVVSVRNGREMTVRELDTIEEANKLFFKVLGNLSSNMGPRDHMMILYTPQGGTPARQVILSRRRGQLSMVGGLFEPTKGQRARVSAENVRRAIAYLRRQLTPAQAKRLLEATNRGDAAAVQQLEDEARQAFRALRPPVGFSLEDQEAWDRLKTVTPEGIGGTAAPLHVFPGQENTEIRIFRVRDGFSVVVFDVDSGNTLPHVRIYPTEAAAIARAERMLASGPVSVRVGGKAKPKRNALLERHESLPMFWGHQQTGTVQRQTWLDDVGNRVERWSAQTLDGKLVHRFPGEPRATAYDQTFWSRVDAAQALANAAAASTSGIGRELTPGELRNQRKAIAQDAERALKARDRADLAALRAKVKQAFEGKRNARKAASALCAVVKSRAKTTCITSRASAKAHGDELVSKAKRALKKERAHQAEIRRLTRKAPKSRKAAAAARSSAKAESDSAVLANIDASLVPVWNKVKSRIKPTARMTRTEAFEQWVHDHSAQVAEIQAAAHERLDERELEESERAYFEQQSAAGDAPLPPLTKNERAELIRRLYRAHKPAHRTNPGERMHPGVLMLDTNGTSVLAPLEHMADVQLRELAHRFRTPRSQGPTP